MKTKKLLFYLLAALLGGCVPVMSLHPLYTEKDVVFEEKMLGKWVQDTNETIWEFKCPNEPEKTYKLIFADEEGSKGSYDAHLIKLENKLFMDIYPNRPPWDEEDPNKIDWPFNALFLIPVHTFMKIDSIEPQLKIRFTDDNEMKKLLTEIPNAVEHISIENTPFLTAPTQELQAYVLKYVDDKRLFPEEIKLLRKTSKVRPDPNDIAPNITEPKKASEK